MLDLDKWQEIFQSIGKHKLRTVLTAFGVFWGIFMLVLLLGAGKGLLNGVNHQFADEAVNSIWLYSGRTSVPYKGLKEGRRVNFTNSDISFISEEYDDVDHISGRFYIGGDKTVRYADKALSFPVNCIHPDFKIIENNIVTEGRWLNESDLNSYAKVCVLGRVVKKSLFGSESAIGKEISIDNVMYRVVGEFYDTGGEWEMKRIYIPISTAQKVYSQNDKVQRISFTASGLSTEAMIDLEKRVLSDMAARKLVDPSDKRALSASNNAEDYQSFKSLFNAINGIIWMVGIFSMLAGVIGVSNIMLIIVKERTREIGIRKALGASPWSIISMVLQESIFITGVAGYIGMACGIGLVALMSGAASEFFRNPEVPIGVAITATVILVVAGAIAGLIPAIQAARINPVTAMKAD